MLKFVLGLTISLMMAVSVKAESQLKPFDILWHCDRVTNSVVEMATEIGESIRTNGETYTDVDFATKVFTAVSTRTSMAIKRMEYNRSPKTPFYSALLYEKLVAPYLPYVVTDRKEIGTTNPAFVSTHVFRTCINDNLAIKNNP